MTLDIRLEAADEFDFDKTAAQASLAFGKATPELSSARFSWTYGSGYEKIITASAFLDGEKIGQVAAIIKPMVIGGETHRTAELVDLFVAPEHRALNVGSQIYKRLRAAVEEERITHVYAYANDNASILNKRFFQLKETTILPLRLSISISALVPFLPAKLKVARDARSIAEQCRSHVEGKGNGILWLTGPLERRLQSPIQSYLCASEDGLTVLASPRIIRSVPILVICATFPAPGKTYSPAAANRLIAALCRASGRPLSLYAGWNKSAEVVPTLSIPPRGFETKFTIQSNFLESRKDDISRFEVLDFDYG